MDSNHLPRFLVTSFLFIDTEANIYNQYNQIKYEDLTNLREILRKIGKTGISHYAFFEKNDSLKTISQKQKEQHTKKKNTKQIARSPRQPLRSGPATGIRKSQNEENEICSRMKRILGAGYILKRVLAAVIFRCLNGIV